MADDQEPAPSLIPPTREEKWYAASIAGVIILIVLLAFGFGWAVSAPTDGAMTSRFDLVYKGALVGGALVTFCTVAWRGLVSSKQAEAQIRAVENQAEQLAVTREQNKANERNELAKLLQKGAELIGDEKSSYVAAGIATLQTVALDSSAFSTQAIDLIADHLLDVGSQSHNNVECRRPIAALKQIADAGLSCNRSLRFSGNQRSIWHNVGGVSQVRYDGGTLRFGYNDKLFDGQRYSVRNCIIESGEIAIFSGSFSGCTFSECRIRRIRSVDLKRNTFEDCDFSDCEFSSLFVGKHVSFPALIGTNNYFADDHEPFLATTRAGALRSESSRRKFEGWVQQYLGGDMPDFPPESKAEA